MISMLAIPAIPGYDISKIEAVYAALKTEALLTSLIILAQIVALYLIIRRVMDEYTKAQYTNGGAKPDMKHMLGLLYRYAAFAFVIVLFPFIMKWTEQILADMQTAVLSKIVAESTFDEKAMLAEMDAMTTRFPKSPSLFSNVINTFTYMSALYFKPFMAWLIRYMYTICISGRFVYLLLLEIVAPVAIVMLLSKDHQKVFGTWLKHMFICYLLIPAFLLANVFADTLAVTFFPDDPYALMCLIAQLLLKMYLFRMVTKYVFRLI